MRRAPGTDARTMRRNAMSEVTEAVVFNAVPLFILAAAYAAVAAALLSVLWRDRRRAHAIDWALAFVFPGHRGRGADPRRSRRSRAARARRSPLAVALRDRSSRCSPALLLLVRWGRPGVRGRRAGRAQAAEQRVSALDRELDAVAEISKALARARTPVAVARPLVRHVASSSASRSRASRSSPTTALAGRGVYAESSMDATQAGGRSCGSTCATSRRASRARCSTPRP